MWTGNVPMSISDTLKTKANEVWNLIDPDQGGPNPQFKIGVEGQDFDAFLAENGLMRVTTVAAANR